jgi:hypothetical protein
MPEENMKNALENIDFFWNNRYELELGLEGTLECMEHHVQSILDDEKLEEERFDIALISYCRILEHFPENSPKAKSYVKKYLSEKDD